MSAPGRAAKRAERREGRTADAEDANAEEEEAADEEGVARVRRSSRAAPDLAMEARADGLAAAERVLASIVAVLVERRSVSGDLMVRADRGEEVLM